MPIKKYTQIAEVLNASWTLILYCLFILTYFINASGNTIRLFYDRIRKQVLLEQYQETLDDGLGTTYVYNTKGKAIEVKNPLGETITKNTYDLNGNIKTINDITGNSSIYLYDEVNRVKTIKDNKEVTVATYDYYRNDSIKSITVGNGIKTDYSYDGDGNVESLVTVTAIGEVIVDYNYAYDLNGNRLQKVSTKHQNFYHYDSINTFEYNSLNQQVKAITKDGNTIVSKYDAEGLIYEIEEQV